MKPSRRQLLWGGALGLGAAGLGLPLRVHAGEDGPRFLFVMGCFGGASMLDCFAPVDHSEAYTDANRGTVISYDTVQPAGSAFRCPDRSTPYNFLVDHGHEMAVVAYQGSSVNHFEAQARSVNGRSSLPGGRSLTEVVAAAYGSSMALPNIHMGRGGYGEPGQDGSLDPLFQAQVVSNPITFGLSSSGFRGVFPEEAGALGDAERLDALIHAARTVRDERLERISPFGQTFASSRLRQELLSRRQGQDRIIEQAELVDQLLFVPDIDGVIPLERFGLQPSEELRRIQDWLPDSQPASTSGVAQDRLQAQAALAYLLARSGSSCAMTLTDPGTDGFLAFDLSHTDHRSAQSSHWDRALEVTHALIELLKGAEYEDAKGPTGTSLWDRSMILFATEFGRDKWDTGGSFGTGHNMNNGLLMVSPLIQGGQQLGETDPSNGFLCGFDSESGEPTPFDDIEPGEDPLYHDERLPPGEEAIAGTVLKAMGIEFEGQETLPVLLRS